MGRRVAPHAALVPFNQIIGMVAPEARGPRFARILLCRYFPDVLFSILENGSYGPRNAQVRHVLHVLITGRASSPSRRVIVRTRAPKLAHLPGAPPSYDTICSSDVLRAPRPDRFVAVVNAPLHELRLLALTSDGRMYAPRS